MLPSEYCWTEESKQNGRQAPVEDKQTGNFQPLTKRYNLKGNKNKCNLCPHIWLPWGAVYLL